MQILSVADGKFPRCFLRARATAIFYRTSSETTTAYYRYRVVVAARRFLFPPKARVSLFVFYVYCLTAILDSHYRYRYGAVFNEIYNRLTVLVTAVVITTLLPPNKKRVTRPRIVRTLDVRLSRGVSFIFSRTRYTPVENIHRTSSHGQIRPHGVGRRTSDGLDRRSTERNGRH